MAIHDDGGTAQVFISNVLNGAVTRLDRALTANSLALMGYTQIGAGFTHRTDRAN
jgi:hypothetical protein